MRKGYLCLFAVAMVIASIMIAGCTTSNQANQASSSETSNATTTSAAKTTNSSVASASPTSPSPSGSPTVATPTPSIATPTPSVSQKTATSIQFTSPSVTKGQSLGINVISSASGLRICTPGLVTATIGTVTSGGSDCYSTAFLNTGSLNPGTYDVTLKFAGDSTYQPSQSTIRITIISL